MTKKEIILQKKATALNAIRKIYNPHNYDSGVGLGSSNWDDSWSEQRDDMVKEIIDNLEEELHQLKNKNNETNI